MPTSIPDDALPADVADLLSRASRKLRRTTNQRLGPLGLNAHQARALRVLGAARPGPVRMGDLAAALRIERRSATSVVDELEARGLAARTPDPVDRRGVLVGLTGDGNRRLLDLTRHRLAAAELLLGPLSQRDRTLLRNLLRRLDLDA